MFLKSQLYTILAVYSMIFLLDIVEMVLVFGNDFKVRGDIRRVTPKKITNFIAISYQHNDHSYHCNNRYDILQIFHYSAGVILILYSFPISKCFDASSLIVIKGKTVPPLQKE